METATGYSFYLLCVYWISSFFMQKKNYTGYLPKNVIPLRKEILAMPQTSVSIDGNRLNFQVVMIVVTKICSGSLLGSTVYI